MDDPAGDRGEVSADASPTEVALRLAVRVVATELPVLRAARHHQVLPGVAGSQCGVPSHRGVQEALLGGRVEAETGTGAVPVAEGAAGAAGRAVGGGEGDGLDGGVTVQVATPPGGLRTGCSHLRVPHGYSPAHHQSTEYSGVGHHYALFAERCSRIDGTECTGLNRRQ